MLLSLFFWWGDCGSDRSTELIRFTQAWEEPNVVSTLEVIIEASGENTLMTESGGLGCSRSADFGVWAAVGAGTGSALALVMHLTIHLSRTSTGPTRNPRQLLCIIHSGLAHLSLLSSLFTLSWAQVDVQFLSATRGTELAMKASEGQLQEWGSVMSPHSLAFHQEWPGNRSHCLFFFFGVSKWKGLVVGRTWVRIDLSGLAFQGCLSLLERWFNFSKTHLSNILTHEGSP